jgi:hypothetical protein
MKTKLLTFLLALTFLFLFSSISFSQTFKCEFVSEKFKGGKTNKGECSGEPEILFSGKFTKVERTEHCRLSSPSSTYEDYLDFKVDVEKKVISYNEVQGITRHELNEMIEYHKRKGSKTEKEVRESYDKKSKMFSGKRKGEILSVNTHINEGMLYEKGLETTQYLIVYKSSYIPNEEIYSLYIPDSGNSILTWYNFSNNQSHKGSWVNHRFGKCVNTSKEKINRE